jgi:hypothetical protein
MNWLDIVNFYCHKPDGYCLGQYLPELTTLGDLNMSYANTVVEKQRILIFRNFQI